LNNGLHVTSAQLLPLLTALPPIVLAVALHEVAHGWTARWFGDSTAERMGRLSLNPLRHIDPIGTVLLPLLLLKFFGVAFGWAKPVPVDWQRLRNPRRDMAFVAIAGPAANLAMLLAWALLMKLGLAWGRAHPWLLSGLLDTGKVGIIANAVLMVINLVPIPPLDGSRVLAAALPRRLAYEYQRLEPFGLALVMLLLLSNSLGKLLDPLLAVIERLALQFAGS
jgi:Zn-dependent protease